MTDRRGVDLHFDQAHPARIYSYWLGGKDHFKVDRDAGEEMAAKLPSLPATARANRAFMVRVARYLAAARGIRQFLDIGTGLPATPNLHEVVQAVDPACRVVYVDNDPVVLVHARALMAGTSSCLEADLRDPADLMEQARRWLDFEQPVAVTILAILHLFPDEEQVDQILKEVTARLCPGSAVAVSIVTGDSDPARARVAQAAAARHGLAVALRRRGEVLAMLARLELVDPGVVLVHRWRPDPADPPLSDRDVHLWGAVAIRPGAG